MTNNNIFAVAEEKLTYTGADALTTKEALALLLGPTSDKALTAAETSLQSFDTLAVSELPKNLQNKAKALNLLLRRFSNPSKGFKIRCPEDAYTLLRGRIFGQLQERMFVICLDGANQPISVDCVTVGLANMCMIHPREIFRRAIEKNACSIMLAHNHPSGNLEPSPEDKALTERIVRASNIIGIKVLDHLVVTDEGYMSFKERGLM